MTDEVLPVDPAPVETTPVVADATPVVATPAVVEKSPEQKRIDQLTAQVRSMGRELETIKAPKVEPVAAPTEAPTMEQFGFDQAKYDKLNAAIVGVSVDSVDSHVEFCTKENLTFKLLADEKHEVVNSYGSTQKFGANEVAARNTFVVDPQGTIRQVFLKVNPQPHSAEVLTALADLQKKK
jgi:peroxiredoxin